MLGFKLKDLRTTKELKMREIAQKLGIDQSLLSKFESELRRPTKEQVLKLAHLYGDDVNDLLKTWLADKVLSEVYDYPFADDVIQMVSENIAGYNTLIQKPEKQILNKAISKLLNEIDVLKQKIDNEKPLGKLQLKKINEYFFTDYTYESNKIEGNTLSLQETALVINDGITIGGKSVREHLEAINHKEAIDYVNDIVTKKVYLNERCVKDLHYLILKSIHQTDAGAYRKTEVRITGSKHEPPTFIDVPFKMLNMFKYYTMQNTHLHPVILAADMHQILVGIHPFIDGNGRTSRLVMNLILMQNGYYIANIKGNMPSRLKYYQALEKAHVNGQVTDFRILVCKAVKQSLTEYYKLIK
jgi:Fic family protein